MEKTKIISQITTHIQAGELEKAISYGIAYLKDKDFSLLASRFYRIKKSNARGILSRDQYQSELNQVTNDLLDILQDYPERKQRRRKRNWLITALATWGIIFTDWGKVLLLLKTIAVSVVTVGSIIIGVNVLREPTKANPPAPPQELTQLLSQDTINNILFSPDGKLILTQSAKKVSLWDLEGKLLRTFSNGYENVSFSPDGKSILTQSPEQVEVWDLEGKLLIAHPFTKHGFNHATFSPDGKNILAQSYDQIVLFDFIGQSPITQTIYPPLALRQHGYKNATFSPDGQIILIQLPEKVALWDLQNREHIEFPYNAFGYRYGNASFSPDGQRILTQSRDTLLLWDIKGNFLSNFTHYNYEAAIFSPDGQGLLTRSREVITLWDIQGQLKAALPPLYKGGEYQQALFSPDGQRILTLIQGNLAVWNLSGQLLTTSAPQDTAITHLLFSPNGKKLLTCSAKGESASLLDSKQFLGD